MLKPVPLLLRLLYYFPDHPLLIAPEFTLQIDDIVPHIPKVHRFLSNLKRDTGIVFNRIELAGGALRSPREVRYVDDVFQLN